MAVTEHRASSDQSPFFVTYDANNNISEYIDNSGNIVAHYKYSPVEKLTASLGSKAGQFNH